MGYLNKVMIIGRMGQDPEVRITPGGAKVANISIATTEYFKDAGGNKQEKTEWHRVVLWNRLAEIVESYTQKGSQLYVEGSLATREWQDKDGNRRFSTDITARAVQLMDKKGDTPAAMQPEPDRGSGSPAAETSGESDDFVEEDVPF